MTCFRVWSAASGSSRDTKDHDKSKYPDLTAHQPTGITFSNCSSGCRAGHKDCLLQNKRGTCQTSLFKRIVVLWGLLRDTMLVSLLVVSSDSGNGPYITPISHMPIFPTNPSKFRGRYEVQAALSSLFQVRGLLGGTFLPSGELL